MKNVMRVILSIIMTIALISNLVMTVYSEDSINDEEFGSIEVKKNIGNNDGPPQKDVTFNLLLNGQKVSDGVTDVNGMVEFVKLKPGDYTLQEVVPSGYTTDLDTTKIYKVEANKETKGQVVNTKIEGIGTIIVKKNISSSEGAPHPGVTFKLMRDNQEIRNGITDKDGIVRFGEVESGNYTLEEVVPSGYTTDLDTKKEYKVEANKETEIQVINTKIEEEIRVGTIIVKKNIGNSQGAPHPGVTFKLMSDDQEIRNGITDKDGIVRFEEVESGNYTLQEVVPSGYRTDLDSTKIYKIEGDKETEIQVINIKTKKRKKRKTGTIKVKKNIGSSEGAVQEGITFQLMFNGQKIAEGITDENGIVRFEELRARNYTLEEVVPEGYTTNLDSKEIYKVEAKKETEIQVINTKIEEEIKIGTIKVKKNIGSSEGTPQQGVTFKLMLNGEKVVEGITDENGIVMFDELEAGNYTLEEVVPEGYTTDLNSKEIYKVEAKKETEIQVINTKIEEEIKIGTIIVKKNLGSSEGSPQQGITFKLMFNGEKIAEGITDENGIVMFDELEPGDYTLEEVVPKGYTTDLNSKEIYKVEAEKETEIQVINTEIEVNKKEVLPKTGGTPLSVYLGTGILFILVGFFYKRKSNKIE